MAEQQAKSDKAMQKMEEQERQKQAKAEKEAQAAPNVLPRAARECFKWLLCPVQDDAEVVPAPIEKNHSPE